MNVRDGMTPVVLTIGPGAHAARGGQDDVGPAGGRGHRDGSGAPGIGIMTERDVLDCVGAGQDPDAELVAAHRTDHLVLASPEWTLDQAASAMVAGNFRHLVVIDGAAVAGLLSMRDIVRCWVGRRGGHSRPGQGLRERSLRRLRGMRRVSLDAACTAQSRSSRGARQGSARLRPAP